MDAKATLKVGPFSRGGTSRVAVHAADHDFPPDATVTPVGLFLPEWDELFLYQVTSKVTSDCLVDCLTRWWARVRERYAPLSLLVLNLDNGPENHSRRTQFLARLVDFVAQFKVSVRLAYYPPTTPSTTPSSAAGASWSCTGMGLCSIRSRRWWPLEPIRITQQHEKRSGRRQSARTPGNWQAFCPSE
jgi:Rhodopirellula transposase DDE domain